MLLNPIVTHLNCPQVMPVQFWAQSVSRKVMAVLEQSNESSASRRTSEGEQVYE